MDNQAKVNAVNNPSIQDWLLGVDGIATRLRQLRGQRTGREVAQLSGLRPAKLSKLELGQQIPTPADIRAITAATGAGAGVTEQLVAKLAEMPSVQTAAARRSLFGQLATQQRLAEMAQAASTICVFDMVRIPRLLQTLDYASAHLADQARQVGVDPELPAAAEAVMAASQVLTRQDCRVEVLIAEPAMRWPVGGPAVMRKQLDWLSSLISSGNGRIGVLPLDAPLSAYPAHSFELFDEVGCLPVLHGLVTLSSDQTRRYRSAYEMLWEGAVEGRKARKLVQTLADRI